MSTAMSPPLYSALPMGPAIELTTKQKRGRSRSVKSAKQVTKAS